MTLQRAPEISLLVNIVSGGRSLTYPSAINANIGVFQMEPLQKFQATMKSLRAVYKLIGQDVFANQFRRGKICYIISPLALILVLFYSLDLILTNDLSESIRLSQASMLIGGIQVPIKYFLMKDLQALRPVVAFFEDIYRKNSQPIDEYYGLCRRYARITELIFKIGVASYATIVGVAILAAAFESFLTMTPLFCFYFPLFHEYSIGQLLLLNGLIGATAFANVIIMPSGDMFIYLVATNLTMIPLIIEWQMEQLSSRLEQCQASVIEIKRRWLHYILIHQAYVRYEKGSKQANEHH